MFHIGGCTNCHTAKDGPLLAGGDPIATPFGDFYAPNITPDLRPGSAVGAGPVHPRHARGRSTRRAGRYYPAFPYTSFTHMSDEDLTAPQGLSRTRCQP